MLLKGQWLQCDQGIYRPVIRAELESGDRQWLAVELLVDTGADRTVISANVLKLLNLPATEIADRLGGVGGVAACVEIHTQLRLPRDEGQWVSLSGQFAACPSHEALDMSVLGRDVLNLFAVVVDRRADLIALIGGRHAYEIHLC